jgi:hypothetical protein
VLLALLTPGPLPGQAADPELAAGLRQVREGDYEGAVVTLDAVARRLAGDESRRRDLLEAYVNLGVALVALDQRTAAKDRFRLAIGLDPKLELPSDRYSPKVLGVFAEARREAAEAAARKTKGTAEPKAKGGSSKLPLVLLGAGGAAAGVVALATRGGGSSGDGATFNGASFSPLVVDCLNGNVEKPLPVTIIIYAVGGRSATTITSASVVLIIKVSPDVPSEVGTASPMTEARITPSTVPAGASLSLRADTMLLCSNAAGDKSRYNEWSGRLTLVTDRGPVALETVDLLHINIP